MSTETTRLKLSDMEEWKRKAALYDAIQADALSPGERAEVIAALEPFARYDWEVGPQAGILLTSYLDGQASAIRGQHIAKVAYLHRKLTATPEATVAQPATTEPNDTAMLDWIAANCEGIVRATDITRWCVESDREGADLRETVRAAMGEAPDAR